MGAAAALLGSALAVKPILRIDEGRIEPFEKVRTSAKALSRLEELAVEAADDAEVDVAVAHLASPDRADRAGRAAPKRLDARSVDREVSLGEIGAVLGAHVGPGMVAVAVSRRAELHSPLRTPVVHRLRTRASRRTACFLASGHAQAVTGAGRGRCTSPARAART